MRNLFHKQVNVTNKSSSHTRVRFIHKIDEGHIGLVIRGDGIEPAPLRPGRYIGRRRVESIPLVFTVRLTVPNEPPSHLLRMEVLLNPANLVNLFVARRWRSLNDMVTGLSNDGVMLFASMIQQTAHVQAGQLFQAYLSWEPQLGRDMLYRLGKIHRSSVNMLAHASVVNVAYDVVLCDSK